ncbi:hypothetical protein CIK05_11650 [Bdellovibrio sp. qaytius]|nr:hypothetical protein CIK05_11650 [Bdellovibrio sp. qaytius]
MRTISISVNGTEKARCALNAKSFLIGRSPSCDIVLRAPEVKPVQYLLEWIGDEDFNSNNGMWMLVNLEDSTEKNSDGVMGDILNDTAPLIINNLSFTLVQDRLAQTDLKKGMLTRQINADEKELLKNQQKKSVLEVICYRSDLESITDVLHYQLTGPMKFNPLPEVKNLRFVWENEGLGFLDLDASHATQEKVEIKSKGVNYKEKIYAKAEKLPVSQSEVFRIQSGGIEYFLRYVSKIDAEVEKFSIWRDRFIQLFLVMAVLLISLSYLVKSTPIDETIAPVEPPRIATIEIKKVEAPVQAPPPEEVAKPIETPVAPVAAKPAETKPVTQPTENANNKAAKKNNDVENTPLSNPVAKPVQASPAAPTVKNVAEDVKPRAGLNNNSTVKNVNTVGLLGKIKAGGTDKPAKVSADMILNQGVVTDTISGNEGLAVQKPRMGELGANRPGEGASGNSPGLAAASTRLRNSGDTNENSVGTIGAQGASSLKSLGSTLGKGEGIGSGSKQAGVVDGVAGGTGMEALGGLTKEDIRKALAEHRRAIRNCYEIALIKRKELEGKMSFKWKVSPTGPVEVIDLMSTEFNLPSFETCVKDVVKRIVFPKAANGQPTTVKYPFVFQGRK